MRTRTLLHCLLLGTVLVLVGTSRVASTAALGFMNAKAWHFADRDCFYDGVYAAIWNTCDSGTNPNPRKVLLAAMSTSSGNHTFRATATDKGSGAGALPTCRAIINANDNSFFNQTNLTIVGLTETPLGVMNFPGSSYSHHFDCDLYGGRYGISSAVW